MRAIANILMIVVTVILIYSFMSKVLPEEKHVYEKPMPTIIRDTVEVTTVAE
jgi:hypothetical protein